MPRPKLDPLRFGLKNSDKIRTDYIFLNETEPDLDISPLLVRYVFPFDTRQELAEDIFPAEVALDALLKRTHGLHGNSYYKTRTSLIDTILYSFPEFHEYTWLRLVNPLADYVANLDGCVVAFTSAIRANTFAKVLKTKKNKVRICDTTVYKNAGRMKILESVKKQNVIIITTPSLIENCDLREQSTLICGDFFSNSVELFNLQNKLSLKNRKIYFASGQYKSMTYKIQHVVRSKLRQNIDRILSPHVQHCEAAEIIYYLVDL